MKEYLAFADYIGKTSNGDFIYRFDFTVDTETVWGDYFNVAPTALMPDLQADSNSLSSRFKTIFKREMILAKKNFCFSMQDCIDGICPIIFCEIDESTIEYQDKPLFFMFGEEKETVKNVLISIGANIYDEEVVEKGDDSAIDDLIDNIDDMNNDNEIDNIF